MLPREVSETARCDLDADGNDRPACNVVKAIFAVLLKLLIMGFLDVFFPWSSELDVDQGFQLLMVQ